MIAAVVMVGCGENKSNVDVNLRTPGEPDDCEHTWSKWKSFSLNLKYDWFRESQIAKMSPEFKASYLREHPDYKPQTQYIKTTNGLRVAYQERTCSTCGKLDRN
jgi:hypothetical protein